MCSEKRSHGDVYVYLDLCKQKRRADDVLEFSHVPYSDPKQKRASARDGIIEAEEWGGGGGALASINNRLKMIIKK